MAGTYAVIRHHKKIQDRLAEEEEEVEAATVQDPRIQAALIRGFTQVLPLSQSGRTCAQDAFESYTSEEIISAGIIGRAWRQRMLQRGPLLQRKNFLERLELEDQVCVGFARLVLFCLMFVLLYWSSSLGVSSAVKLDTSRMLEDALELDEYRDVKTLSELKDYLPRFSAAVKQFSPSSSLRFYNPNAIQLISQERHFEFASNAPGLTLDVRGSFTFTAWINPADNSGKQYRSIVSNTASNDQGVICWQWSYPSMFKYGAHDFHSVNKEGAWFESVADLKANVTKGLSLEALVVRGGDVSFYRNGELKATRVLPRPITPCDGSVKIGDTGLAISALKFFPRALASNELLDIFSGGATLTEIATGSILDQYEDDVYQVAAVTQQETANEVQNFVENQAIIGRTSATIGNSIAKSKAMDAADNPLLPNDPSPVPDLPSGDESLLVSELERAKWLAGGSPTDNAVSCTWMDSGDGLGTYWSMVKNVTFADWTYIAYIPNGTFADGMEEFTFSFWMKETALDRYSQLDMMVTDADELNFIYIETWGGWISWQMTIEGEKYGYWAEYITKIDDDGFVLEDHNIGAGIHGRPLPLVWRHLAMTMEPGTRALRLYLDGKLLGDSTAGTSYNPSYKGSIPSDVDITAFFHSDLYLYMGTYTHVDVITKVGDVRIYPVALTSQQLINLQKWSYWATGAAMKQCVSKTTAYDTTSSNFYTEQVYYVDSDLSDEMGNDCNFYAQQSKVNKMSVKLPSKCFWNSSLMSRFNAICSNPAAKKHCPVACKGIRQCYDGSNYINYVKPPPPKKYRIWDRVMNLQRPTSLRNGPNPDAIVCPSTSINRTKVLHECKRLSVLGPGSFGPDTDYAHAQQYLWPGFQRLNLTDCNQLEAALGDDYCAWDDSWMPNFQAEVMKTKRYSMRWWTKAVEKSRGMPNAFLPSIHFYSKLMAPFAMLDVQEDQPTMARSTRASIPRDVGYADVWVEPTSSIRNTRDWVQNYVSVEHDAEGNLTFLCLGMSHLPLACDHFDGHVSSDLGESTQAFLEAIEFTTAMLISPIELSATVLTAAELNEHYYAEFPKMSRMLGPSMPESEILRGAQQKFVLDAGIFENKVSVIAPPLLFQTRASLSSCEGQVTQLVAKSQFDLVTAAHCTEDGMCPRVTNFSSIFSCPSESKSSDPYFGLNVDMLEGQKGYADFLYSLADNRVLVRGGKEFDTRAFLDVFTQTSLLLAIFHIPANGLTTVLELVTTMDQYEVKPWVRFIHFSYLKSTDVQELRTTIGLLILTCFFVILLNLALLYRIRREALDWDHPMSRVGIMEVVMDCVQALLVLTVGCIIFQYFNESETNAIQVVGNITSVRFVGANMTFEEKKSSFFSGLDTLKDALNYEEKLRTVCYFVFILMLARIIYATSVHPRTGMLTGTLSHGMNDFAHFAILFLIVFVFFAFTATWMFGSSFEQFADLGSTMNAQFDLLLGNLPVGYRADPLIIVYVVLTNLVMFFLMLNFVLAIVVEAYMKVREDIETLKIENSIGWDLMMVFLRGVEGVYKRWPTRQHMANIIKYRIAARNLSAHHLRLMGLDYRVAQQVIASFGTMDVLIPVKVAEDYFVPTVKNGIVQGKPVNIQQKPPGRVYKRRSISELSMGSSKFGAAVQMEVQESSGSVNNFRGNSNSMHVGSPRRGDDLENYDDLEIYSASGVIQSVAQTALLENDVNQILEEAMLQNEDGAIVDTLPGQVH